MNAPKTIISNAIINAVDTAHACAVQQRTAGQALFDLFRVILNQGADFEAVNAEFGVKLAAKCGTDTDLLKGVKSVLKVYVCEIRTFIRLVDAGAPATGADTETYTKMRAFNKAHRALLKPVSETVSETETESESESESEPVNPVNRLAHFAASIQAVLASGVSDEEAETARGLLTLLSVELGNRAVM